MKAAASSLKRLDTIQYKSLCTRYKLEGEFLCVMGGVSAVNNARALRLQQSFVCMSESGWDKMQSLTGRERVTSIELLLEGLIYISVKSFINCGLASQS